MILRAAFWAALFAAAWFAWAWLSVGWLPLGALLALLVLDVFRRHRGVGARPGLPRPLDGATVAAYGVGMLCLALLLGYGPDWLVLAGLAVGLIGKVRDELVDRRPGT